MPELPEVETVVRTLAPRITGRRILEARFFSRIVAPRPIAGKLAGRTILGVRRHGKFILADLDVGVLTIHLGMTGRLLAGGEPGPHTRALFRLDDLLLVYDDPRHFGRIEWSPVIPERVAALGPEPLDVSFEELRRRLAGRRSPIKPLLLNQRFLRGIGNIYADESLFRAGIHPRASAMRLGPVRARRLYDGIREVLTAAIAAGGSSVSDYVDAEGRPGWFQFQHGVYGRDGEPCVHCRTRVRRIVLGGRGTHFCPKCQRI